MDHLGCLIAKELFSLLTSFCDCKYIALRCPCNLDPFKFLFYAKKLGYTGVYVFLLKTKSWSVRQNRLNT